MFLNDADPLLSASNKQELLRVAEASIEKGLSGQVLTVNAGDYAEPLRALRATFVTLHVDHQLRGCIGTLEARHPLVEDVGHNAWGAAFRDTRFSALTWSDLDRLAIHISVLSSAEPMQFSSEDELLSLLRPHVDGLILEAGEHRGTFLPSVWEQLPAPRDFLRQLKQKAGLSPDYWSPQLRVRRYTTVSFP